MDYTLSMPAGSGYRQFMHYGQLANSGEIQILRIYSLFYKKWLEKFSVTPERPFSKIRFRCWCKSQTLWSYPAAGIQLFQYSNKSSYFVRFAWLSGHAKGLKNSLLTFLILIGRKWSNSNLYWKNASLQNSLLSFIFRTFHYYWKKSSMQWSPLANLTYSTTTISYSAAWSKMFRSQFWK